MATSEEARRLLARSGSLRPQPATDWTGPFPLPADLTRFYAEVGPADVGIESFGNPFFLPCLARLWPFQAGYRWHGLTGEPSACWSDEWLVVASRGGDPLILSRSSGAVLFAEHGRGDWEPGELFADLSTMAACLGLLGTVVATAGDALTDDEFRIRPEWRDEATVGLRGLLGSARGAEMVLGTLGWG